MTNMGRSKVPDTDQLYHFRDPQQAPVYGFCPLCGREIYNWQDEICLFCQEGDKYGSNERDDAGET